MFKNNILGSVPNAECHSKTKFTLPFWRFSLKQHYFFIFWIFLSSFWSFFSLFLAIVTMIARQINSKSLKKLDFWMVKKFSKPTEDFRGASSQVLQRLLRESSRCPPPRARQERKKLIIVIIAGAIKNGHQQVHVPKSYHRLDCNPGSSQVLELLVHYVLQGVYSVKSFQMM